LFDELKDWVEFNCVKRIRKASAQAQGNDEPGISISVDFSEQEYGGSLLGGAFRHRHYRLSR